MPTSFYRRTVTKWSFIGFKKGVVDKKKKTKFAFFVEFASQCIMRSVENIDKIS